MPSSATGTPINTLSLFTPPSGGDIILRSSDGVDFLVHSMYLKLTSSVFADMISISTEKDTVQLTEDATSVSYLLRFIYPNKLPLTVSPEALSVCLEVVQKYDVGGATEMIDELVALDTLPPKFLSSDPIRAFQLAAQFNLAKTKVAAAPLITTDLADFCGHGIAFRSELPFARIDKLDEHSSYASKATNDYELQLFYDLSCQTCRSSINNPELYDQVPPSWALAWVRLVYETLLTSSEPFAELDHLFQLPIFEELEGQRNVCQNCLDDFKSSSYQGSKFESWAEAIKGVLGTQLGKLDLVYAL